MLYGITPGSGDFPAFTPAEATPEGYKAKLTYGFLKECVAWSTSMAHPPDQLPHIDKILIKGLQW